MINVRPIFRDFAASETGAVTVDWVVMTGSLVGLGLVTLTLVSGGLEDLAGDVSADIAGIDPPDWFADGELLAMGFAGGLGDWAGGVVADIPGFGEVLQLGPGELAELSIDVPEGASSATVSFDMLALDDLDGEAATVYINGQPVAIYRDDHGNITTSDLGASGVTVSVDQQYSNDAVGSGTHGSDSRATYTIEVSDPGTPMTFGVASNANEGVDNEFYAIDDVRVTTR